MGVRIFCNTCETFIRNAKKEEFKTLSGDEICTGCAGKIETGIQAFEKAADRAIKQIGIKRTDGKATLDRMLAKVVEGS